MTQLQIDGHAVEFELDREYGTWSFCVPSLGIAGGGQKVIEEAQRAAAEEIAFLLQDIAVSRAEIEAAVAEIEAGRGLSPDEIQAALERPEKGD